MKMEVSNSEYKSLLKQLCEPEHVIIQKHPLSTFLRRKRGRIRKELGARLVTLAHVEPADECVPVSGLLPQ